jgi:hypothetical protein
MPDRSKVMAQTKRHTGPPGQGIGHAASDRTLEKFSAEKAQENNSGSCKAGRLKREKDYERR